MEHRSADPFYISEETKKRLAAVHPYWKGKTTSELARSLMAPETLRAMDHNFFTPGNYYYNGVGHVNVHYDRVIYEGLEGIMAQTAEELSKVKFCDPNYGDKKRFLEAVIITSVGSI